MKIAYMHQYFSTKEMSGITRSYELAKRLEGAGHEVHVVSTDRNPGPGKRDWYLTEDSGMTIHWLPVQYSNAMGYRKRMAAFAAFAARAGSRVCAISPDVIYASTSPLTIAIPAVYASKRIKSPMVLEVRDLWPEMPIAVGALKNPVSKYLARQLETFAYRNAKHIVALSDGMKAGIIDKGQPTDKITVIQNGCDFDLFDVPVTDGDSFRQANDWLGTRPLIVYTGTLGIMNGVGYLADIAHKMLQIDLEIRFLVVGTGYERQTIEDHAKELNVLGKNFFMIPDLAKTDIPSVLSAATICTSLFIDVPEMWVNSANKFFDSLAASRPIAINYQGWQAKLIEDNDCGVVLPPVDPAVSAKRIAHLIRNEEWLRLAGERANQLGHREFDRDALGCRLIEVLEKATCNLT